MNEGYKPMYEARTRQSFNNTMEALKTAESSLPTFQSSYDSEINRLYEQIVNRPAFRYDPTTDPVYGAYRDRYVREGRMAMRDSIGQTAHLTGGYTSSYAQSVGQQQYGAYLEKLGQIMPELYSAAYERYQAENGSLNDQLGAARGMADMEFARYKDERDRAAEAEQQSYERRWAAYQNLIDLISRSGYIPDRRELEATGMSQGQAEALYYEYLRVNDLLPDDSASSSTGSYAGAYAGSSQKNKAAESSAGAAKEDSKIAANARGVANTSKSRRD